MRDIKDRMIRNHYIEQLNKLGVRQLDGQPLHKVHSFDLRKELAVQRAVRS